MGLLGRGGGVGVGGWCLGLWWWGLGEFWERSNFFLVLASGTCAGWRRPRLGGKETKVHLN